MEFGSSHVWHAHGSGQSKIYNIEKLYSYWCAVIKDELWTFELKFPLSSCRSRRSQVKTERRQLTKSWSANSAFHLTSHKKPGTSWNEYGLFVWSLYSSCVSKIRAELLCKFSFDILPLVVQLLKRNASSRLGAGAGDATEVQVRTEIRCFYIILQNNDFPRSLACMNCS